jgi:soluble lytic murein transglycosylase-like protein
MNIKTMSYSIFLSSLMTLLTISATGSPYPVNYMETAKIIEPQVLSKKTVLTKNEKRLRVYDQMIVKTSARHDIDPDLVRAIIMAESLANTHAVSKKGATGLMQIMPKTAKSMGVKNSRHPAQNIEAGTKYLKCLMDEYDGNIKMALAAYNAGPGTVKKYKGIPPYKETRSYIKKVLAYYEECRTKTNI